MEFFVGCRASQLKFLRALALSLWLSSHGAAGQILTLEDATLPSNRSLETLATYYIFAFEDAPDKLAMPSVKYLPDLSVHSDSTATDASMKDYRGVQLSLVKYDELFTKLDSKDFCCMQLDVNEGKCAHVDELLVKKKRGQSYDDAGVFAHTVRFPGASGKEDKEAKLKLRETGIYVLMISNCGELQSGKVSGTIVVKNSHGFLPGNEYYKMPLYGWLAVAYMVFAVLWAGLSFQWWKEMINVQFFIAGLIMMGLLESVLWYLFYSNWNEAGTRGNIIFVLAVTIAVMKSSFSFMLVLVASLGWGVTRPYLDKDVTLRIHGICWLYIAMGITREIVTMYQQDPSPSWIFILLCLLPSSFLNAVIFYWIFTALSALIQTLKDRGQTAKLQLFEKLWSILVLSLAIGTATLLYQIWALSSSIDEQWRKQWLFTDGVPQLVFASVLLSMMYLWAPHKNSQRYAYSQFDMKTPDAASDQKPSDWANDVNGMFGDDSEDEDANLAAPAATVGASSSPMAKHDVEEGQAIVKTT